MAKKKSDGDNEKDQDNQEQQPSEPEGEQEQPEPTPDPEPATNETAPEPEPEPEPEPATPTPEPPKTQRFVHDAAVFGNTALVAISGFTKMLEFSSSLSAEETIQVALVVKQHVERIRKAAKGAFDLWEDTVWGRGAPEVRVTVDMTMQPTLPGMEPPAEEQIEPRPTNEYVRMVEEFLALDQALQEQGPAEKPPAVADPDAAITTEGEAAAEAEGGPDSSVLDEALSIAEQAEAVADAVEIDDTGPTESDRPADAGDQNAA